METQKVGIREFRDKLASYVLESKAPIAITRHGDTVGVYFPLRRKRTEAEWAAFDAAAAEWQRELDESGITEEELVADFKKWRAAETK